MRVLELTLKDCRQIVRDRKVFIFLLILPVVFTLLFGFAFGGDSTADPRLPIGLLDEDGGELAQELVALLRSSHVVRVATDGATVSDLEQQVADEDVAAAVLIPATFGEGVRRGDSRPVTVIGGGQAGMAVEAEVQTAVFHLASAVQAAGISTEMAVAQGVVADAAAELAHYDEALARALDAWEAPPVTVESTASGVLAEAAGAEEVTAYSAYAHSSPGMMAQFAIAGLISAAAILVAEKKSRSLQRLLTTNLSRVEIMLGHFLAMCLMIFAQLFTLILFGQLVLDLPYFEQPLATLLLTLGTTLFCAALGLAIGMMARSEEQVIVFALVPMFVLAALGGAWMPLEFTPAAFQQVAFMTPLAWVIDGYKDILVRGQGIEALGTALAVLLGYTAVLFAASYWRLRRI